MKMLIGEKFVDASNGQTDEVVNPATGKFIDTVPSATKEDVQVAISNAVEAQVKWAALTVRERTDKILKAASLIKARRLELGKLLSQESGKPYMAEAVWEFDSVAYILEGELTVDYGAHGTRTYKQGQSLMEAMSVAHYRTLGAFAQRGFKFRECHLNWVEVGRIRRQIAHLGADRGETEGKLR